MSCHHAPSPGPGDALCAFAWCSAQLLRAGAGPAGGGGSGSPGDRLRPSPQFPRLQHEDWPLRGRKAHNAAWPRDARSSGASGRGRRLGNRGLGSPRGAGSRDRLSGTGPVYALWRLQGKVQGSRATFLRKGRSSHSTLQYIICSFFHLFTHPCIHPSMRLFTHSL